MANEASERSLAVLVMSDIWGEVSTTGKPW